MSWFKKKKVDPDREEFKKQFESVISSLNQGEKIARIAVGHSINMANSVFLKAHGSVEKFKNLPRVEQFGYLTKLTELESKMWEQDPMSSIGVGLFKMWLTTVMEGDTELNNQFSKELAVLSKVGDLPV
ncbi:MAG: hypothetical protein H7A05_06845 [Pseudomonadales bacterium]|nr:hypothetical protein [Pseudomonadales bacterium]MCP5344319.1 hypothetical protein [Pseudomonadales bacterium]